MRNIKQHSKDQSNHERTIMLIVHIDAVLATCAIHLSVLAKFVSITQHSLTQVNATSPFGGLGKVETGRIFAGTIIDHGLNDGPTRSTEVTSCGESTTCLSACLRVFSTTAIMHISSIVSTLQNKNHHRYE